METGAARPEGIEVESSEFAAVEPPDCDACCDLEARPATCTVALTLHLGDLGVGVAQLVDVHLSLCMEHATELRGKMS